MKASDREEAAVGPSDSQQREGNAGDRHARLDCVERSCSRGPRESLLVHFPSSVSFQSPISSCVGGVLPPRHFSRAAGGEKNRIMAGEVHVLLSKPHSLSSRHGLACSTPMAHLHTHPSPRWSAVTGDGGCPSSCGKRQHKLLLGS